MILYYKNKNNKNENDYIKFKSSNFSNDKNYDTMKLTKGLKTSISRKLKISLDEYILKNYNFEIKKCGFCGFYAWYDLKFKFEKYKKTYLVIIEDLIYSKNFYCKGKNKNCEGKKYNPNSVIFVSKTINIDEKKALELIHNRNKSPFYLENYKSYDEYKNYQSLKSRLNEEEYESFIKNLKNSKTIEYYLEKYGSEEGEKIWNEICKKKDSMSMNYFLKKNNGDYKKSIIEYKNRIKSVMPVCHGFGGFYSKESFVFFTNLIKIIKINDNDIIFGEDEFFLEYFDETINKKRKFFYDFIDLKNKIIIEYNGKRWHPNKYKMTTEEYNNWYHPFDKTLKKEDLENKDILKEKVATDNNYNYIVIWDCDKNDHNLKLILDYYKNKNLL